MASSRKKTTAEHLDFDEDWSPEADTLRGRMLLMDDFNVWVPLKKDQVRSGFFLAEIANSATSLDFICDI